jgi:protein gp37
MACRLAAMGNADYYRATRCNLGDEGFELGTRWNGNTVFAKSQLNKPLKIKKPTMFFVCSMGDLFHYEVPYCWIMWVFDVIRRTPQHTYHVLTKRIARAALYASAFGPLPDNVWLGTTAENQDLYDDRAYELVTTKAAKRFLSVEPMLGPIRLGTIFGAGGIFGIDWVIVGCESLPGGRAGIGTFADEAAWWEAAHDLYQQCREAGIAFFFKQGPVQGRVVKPEKNLYFYLPPFARVQEWPA